MKRDRISFEDVLAQTLEGSEQDLIPTMSPDGRWLIGLRRSDANYVVYRTSDWGIAERLPIERTATREGLIAFSRNGQMAALVTDARKVSLRETDHWTELASLPAPTLVVQIRFSTDDSQLAIGNEAGLLEIWDLRQIRGKLAAMGLDFPIPPIPASTTPPCDKPLRWELATNSPPRIIAQANSSGSATLNK